VTHIIIFAKQPQPGQVKTRLIPALGADGAAQLAQRMLRHTIAQALAANIGPVELNVTPPNWLPLLEQEFGSRLRLSTQIEGDLGARMAAACRAVQLEASIPGTAITAAASRNAVMVIGTDCPQLTSAVLRSAHDALANHDACLVPAEDGGYVALAMRCFQASVFNNIHWSTATVAEETRARMRALNWRWLELPALSDIDHPEDLKNLPHDWPRST